MEIIDPLHHLEPERLVRASLPPACTSCPREAQQEHQGQNTAGAQDIGLVQVKRVCWYCVLCFLTLCGSPVDRLCYVS